jgi:transcription elongation factor Elf1
MCEIPIGKALLAVKTDSLDACDQCALFVGDLCTLELACDAEHRRDGVDVFFKLIDLYEAAKYIDRALERLEVKDTILASHNLEHALGVLRGIK